MDSGIRQMQVKRRPYLVLGQDYQEKIIFLWKEISTKHRNNNSTNPCRIINHHQQQHTSADNDLPTGFRGAFTPEFYKIRRALLSSSLLCSSSSLPTILYPKLNSSSFSLPVDTHWCKQLGSPTTRSPGWTFKARARILLFLCVRLSLRTHPITS